MFLNKKPTYKSLNDQTGLLEDIQEVREQGLALADMLFMVLSHPLVSLFVPRGLKVDVLTLAAQTVAMLKPTSQAETLRILGKAMDMDPREVEWRIMYYGLSETLPATHPDAPNPKTEPLDKNDPLVKESLVLSRLAELDAKQPTEPPTRLSEGLESILRELEQKKQKDGGE